MSSNSRAATFFGATATFGLLAACQTYQPSPLDSDGVESVLNGPTRSGAPADQATSPLQLARVQLDTFGPLSAQDVGVLAVLSNPELIALRTRQQIADAQIFASGLLPDPQLSLNVDRVLSPPGVGLVSAYAGGLSLEGLAKLLTHRVDRDVTRHAAEALRLDIAWAEWNTAGNARLLAARLQYQVQARELAIEASHLAAQMREASSLAATRGDLKGDELQTQRATFVDATLRAEAASRDAEATRLELNRVLGLRPDATLRLASPTAANEVTLAPALELYDKARHERLDLRALMEGYASQEAGLKRAVLGQYPRVIIGVNRARDTSAVHTWGGSVAFDLPLWNRNRGEIAIQKAARAVLQAEYAARLHQTRAEIVALRDGLEADLKVLPELRVEVEALGRLAAGYEAANAQGDLSRLSVGAARLSILDKRLAVLGLEQSCSERRIALAVITGVALP